MEPSGADTPEFRVYELVARSIGGRLAPGEEAEARLAADAMLARVDSLELLREVAIEEGMLRTLLTRVHAERGEGRAFPHRGGGRGPDGRAPFGPQWQRRNTTAFWRRSVAKAAAILVVVGGVAVAYGTRGVPPWGRRGAPPEPHTVATRPGQRATVRLPDGSSAILAPNTELQYAISAQAGAREVQLDGEAYFEVRHDAARPFRVRTRRAVIEDVGTSFVVRAYAADARARVAVRSGAVTLRARAAHGSSGVALGQGEAAKLDSSGAVVRLAGDPASYWAWTSGRLVFDQASFPEVLQQLHRWYDVDFRLDDSTLAAQYFTGAFEAASLSQVLDILGPLVHARFERRGRVVIVTPRPGSP